MRTIHRYILGSFLSTFAICLSVVTFVMCLGAIFKVTELLASGGSGPALVGILASALPEALAETIPISALTAALLVFGRLSADGELTAMKACGISIWQIASAPLAASLVLGALGLYVNSELAPLSRLHRREMIRSLKSQPLQFFTPGRFVREIPGLSFYIGHKNGTRIRDVIIYDDRQDGGRREIRAASGEILIEGDGQWARLDLRDVRIDPFWDGQPGRAETFSVRKLALGSTARQYKAGIKDWTLAELRARIVGADAEFADLRPEDRAMLVMGYRVEANKRMVLAAFCISFVILGVPLGTKGHRKESSAGILVSMVAVVFGYMFIIVAEALVPKPYLRPDLLIWTPVVLAGALGIVLMRRSA